MFRGTVHDPCSKRLGLAPQFLGTSYIRPHCVTHSNHISRGDQSTDERMVDHATGSAALVRKFRDTDADARAMCLRQLTFLEQC